MPKEKPAPKYFIFDGDVDEESVQKLLDFISSNPGELQISINSGGGSTDDGAFLIKALNTNKDRIVLTGSSHVSSCAFRIFQSFKGRKQLVTGCHGMYHYGSCRLDVGVHGKVVPHHKPCSLSFPFRKKEQDDYAATFMNAKELREFKRGGDVEFDFLRMKELFPDAEII